MHNTDHLVCPPMTIYHTTNSEDIDVQNITEVRGFITPSNKLTLVIPPKSSTRTKSSTRSKHPNKEFSYPDLNGYGSPVECYITAPHIMKLINYYGLEKTTWVSVGSGDGYTEAGLTKLGLNVCCVDPDPLRYNRTGKTI